MHKKALKEVVDTISHNFDTTILMVTHDARDVLSWADEIIVVKNGTIVQHDRPQVVYRKPVNEYVAGLFGEYSLLPEKPFALKGIEVHMIKDLLFFRPEAFTLNQKNTLGSLECIVVNCAFMGAFYSINLKTTFDFIIYAHSDRPLDLNTRVWLSLV